MMITNQETSFPHSYKYANTLDLDEAGASQKYPPPPLERVRALSPKEKFSTILYMEISSNENLNLFDWLLKTIGQHMDM